MKNTQTPTLEIPRELYHLLLETLIQIRIKGKPVTVDTAATNCIEIGNGIRVVEKPDNNTSNYK
ncbi:MAG: hypothetical protein HYU70_13060 [Bacteroidetes bacterium]|nr:hypothetical protein [Bacteroidota bacterium]